MSLAVTSAPESASGTVSEPVPQQQSQMVVPATPPLSSHCNAMSMVLACPSLMSFWTLLTSSASSS